MAALHGSLLVGCFLIICLAIVSLLPTFLPLLQVRLVFILLTAAYNIGQIFHLWFRLASSTVCPSFKLQSGVNVAEPEGDMLNYASTYILTLIMANLLIYCIFYLAMKLISGERPTPWVKLS